MDSFFRTIEIPDTYSVIFISDKYHILKGINSSFWVIGIEENISFSSQEEGFSLFIKQIHHQDF